MPSISFKYVAILQEFQWKVISVASRAFMSPKSRSRLWRSTAKRISSFSTYQDLPGNGRLSRGTRRAAQPPPPHSFVRKSGPGRRPCDEEQVDQVNSINWQRSELEFARQKEQRKLVGNEQSSTYPHSIEVSGANQIQHKPWGRMRRQSCSLFFTLEAVWTTECLHLRVKAQVYTCTTSMMLQIMWQHCQRPRHECTLIIAIYMEMSRQTWLRQWRESEVAFCTYVAYSAQISTIFTSSLDPIPDWFHPAPTVQLCLQPCGYVAVLCWGQKDV